MERMLKAVAKVVEKTAYASAGAISMGFSFQPDVPEKLQGAGMGEGLDREKTE